MICFIEANVTLLLMYSTCDCMLVHGGVLCQNGEAGGLWGNIMNDEC